MAFASGSLLLAALLTSGCWDFTYVAPPGDVEAAAEASLDAGRADADAERDVQTGPACVVGNEYCGGDRLFGASDILYTCEADGGATLVAKCASGCAVAADGSGGACHPAPACVVNGQYCGGDKLDGDPNVLYRCARNGNHPIIERCALGCIIGPPATDDYCRR